MIEKKKHTNENELPNNYLSKAARQRVEAYRVRFDFVGVVGRKVEM